VPSGGVLSKHIAWGSPGIRQDFAMNFLNKKEAYYYPAGAQQTAMENQMTITIYFS
jgi:hypothetical protein